MKVAALFCSLTVLAGLPVIGSGEPRAQPGVQDPAIKSADPALYIGIIKKLTDASMEGRGNGTRGESLAAAFLEQQYRELGLDPGNQNSYAQPFKAVAGAELFGSNRLQEHTDAQNKELQLNRDFIPFSFSSSGNVNAAVAFVGYGITAPEFGYDDYSHIDVRGKIVVMLRFEPLGFVKLSGNPKMTTHADILTKLKNAQAHGAKALLLLNGVLGDDEDDLLTPLGSIRSPESAAIQALHVKNSVVDSWMRIAGKSLQSLEDQFDATARPHSFPFPATLRLEIATGVRPTSAVLSNVLAYVPGQTSEYITVGAHYDHLGYGYQDARDPDQIGKIHPGADDNASGTAGLLELARMLAPFKNKMRRGILFLSFAGEEIGDAGSTYWVTHPTRPLEKTVAMINMDMIGRIQDGKVYVGGLRSGSTFPSILRTEWKDTDLQAEDSTENYAASDQAAFVARRIPALLFSSGLNADYHAASDTWEKIDAPNAAKCLNLIARIILRLDETPQRPSFRSQP